MDRLEAEAKDRATALSCLVAIFITLLLASTWEVVGIASMPAKMEVEGLVALVSITLEWSLRVLWPVVLFQLGCALTILMTRRFPRGHLLAGAGLTLGVVAYLYAVLATYPPFAVFLPFILGLLMLAGWIWLGFFGHTLLSKRIAAGLRILGPVAGLAAFVGMSLANYHFFRHLYPSLHHCVFLAGALLLHQGTTGALGWLRPQLQKRVGWGLPVLVGAPGLIWFLGDPQAISAIQPLIAEQSQVGKALFAGATYDPSKEKKAAQVPEESAPWERFWQYNKLPPLPDGFQIENYNILLITSDATRFDQTSLSDPALGTTPNLAEFAKGAYSLERVYSPSSGTLHSMGSVFSMTYPSFCDLVTWRKPWRGELKQQTHTVAEMLHDLDYSTFWTGHNHRNGIGRMMNGFDQGFDKVDLVVGDRDSVHVDAEVTQKAIRFLEQHAASQKRFFGWIFYISPHHRYKAHYPDWPNKTGFDRYLQEIRYVDEQLEQVLLTLRRTGLLEKTVVIFHSDHGEEFREHGGTLHKTALYRESTHVPLVVRIPGAPGGVMPGSTSLVYLFPWLFSSSRTPLRQAAETRLRKDIGPMLRDTQGAVVIELVGHDRMQSALVYDAYRIQRNLITRRYEYYNLVDDPQEQKDLILDDPTQAVTGIGLFEKYMGIRSSKQRCTFDLSRTE